MANLRFIPFTPGAHHEGILTVWQALHAYEKGAETKKELAFSWYRISGVYSSALSSLEYPYRDYLPPPCAHVGISFFPAFIAEGMHACEPTSIGRESSVR